MLLQWEVQTLTQPHFPSNEKVGGQREEEEEVFLFFMCNDTLNEENYHFKRPLGGSVDRIGEVKSTHSSCREDLCVAPNSNMEAHSYQ